MKKLIKTIVLYRALAIGEERIDICRPFQADILSECYSRILKSSHLYGTPSLICFTENLKVAVEYAGKPGYSGAIASITACLWDNGTCTLAANTDAFVHRLWRLIDWIDLLEPSQAEAINLNYPRNKIPLTSIISYGGQNTARAYSFRSKIWVAHVESQIEYTEIFLAETVKDKLQAQKRTVYPSFNAIPYSLKTQTSNCTNLLAAFNELFPQQKKPWIRNTIKELEEIIKNHCA